MRDSAMAALLALILIPVTADAVGTIEQRTGYAYELGTERLLYTEEHHEHVEQGRVTRSEVIYRNPDGGFDRFIENNWTPLLRGEVFERPFLVPSFQRFLEFRIYLERMTDTEVVFVMEPASMLLRIVGDGIVVAYDRESAALRRYEGISNIRDEDGDNYEVRVEFPADGQAQDVAGNSSRGRSRH